MPDLTGDGINDVDITNAGDSTTIGGVIFTDAVNVGSGTGNYNTFLAISNNSGVEAGFNSDDTPPIDNTNKDIDQAKTHTVLLSSLVQVTINGVQYYQIRLDLNEANSDPNAQISLDQFKIYSSTNGGIESTTTLFTQNLIYDMDATGNVSLLLSDAGSTGSGTDDYSILIPVSEFAGLDPATTYVYLYTQMGAADGADWNAGATFEEFNLENGVTLTGTKFSDLDGDGIKDAGEGGVAGVTIFIDSNQNGSLDVGERTAVTDANGNYSFFGVALNQTLWIDEVIPSGAIQTTGAHETVTIPLNAAPGSTIQVDPIGNHYLTPHVTITKDASFDDGGDCADTVGELINYTVTVANDGELALSNVVVTDSFEGGSDVVISGPDSGDSNNNGLLDVGETWTYTYTHAVTQDDIDSNGGDDDGTLDNTATVNADSANGSVSDDDDASADVCQNPHVTLDKTASVEGDCADTVGELINYSISVTNDGNVTLENVVVTDDFADLGTIAGVDEDTDGFNDGDADEDGKLDVGETWLYTASHAVTQDDIDNNGNFDSDDPADGINDVLRNVA
ncbi:MAG TPA: SdrD B-like domain-containing protein, partial [Sphingomicrobium sp.]|nr:SdrD B-like domain-containing protein [Sphingomicrobium sp.]